MFGRGTGHRNRIEKLKEFFGVIKKIIKENAKERSRFARKLSIVSKTRFMRGSTKLSTQRVEMKCKRIREEYPRIGRRMSKKELTTTNRIKCSKTMEIKGCPMTNQ